MRRALIDVKQVGDGWRVLIAGFVISHMTARQEALALAEDHARQRFEATGMPTGICVWANDAEPETIAVSG